MDVRGLYKLAGIDKVMKSSDVAHLSINLNRVISKNIVPGLHIDTEENKNGVNVKIKVDDNVVIEKQVHLCFGIAREKGLQKILLDIDVGKNSRLSVLSHCIFPKTQGIKHIMEANIRVGDFSSYTYEEKHIHGLDGDIEVYPRAIVKLDRNAKFKTGFELIKGRVGKLDIDYEITADADSTVEMMSKVSGIENDQIRINESCNLVGKRARGVLNSRVAVRNNARADVYNKMIATAPYARGHVDCKEIVQDDGIANAVPIVEVRNPKAHITHEAAIGSVDTKQMETLMARGLTEEEAVGLIIEGLLS